MEFLFAHCAAVFSEHQSLFAVFFLGGLTGSLTHCLAMCGPVVACQAACAGKKGCVSKRLAHASQWQYHLGRLLTYGAMGFVAALLSKQIATLEFWPALSSVMLILAGSMFIFSSLPLAKHSLFHFTSNHPFLRGALMGFMPCGLIYAALMMAATLANPLAGMVAMWLFVLGTMPALLIASAGAEIITQKWQAAMQQMGRAVMAFNGISLILMATRIIK
jgi:sulfite exporter TauE/SafE